MSSAISLPFGFNEFGEVSYSTDPRKIWQDRVYTAILTQTGERLMRPGYGTSFLDASFENEQIAAEICIKAASTAFSTHLKELELVRTTPIFNPDTSTMELSIVYKLPSGEPDTVTLTTAILSRSGDIIQELSNG